MDGKGHPLPASDEARRDEIPEHDERDKGFGDDEAGTVQPAGDAVTPAGETCPVDDSGHAAVDGQAELEADRR